jgi:hypothetical protein
MCSSRLVQKRRARSNVLYDWTVRTNAPFTKAILFPLIAVLLSESVDSVFSFPFGQSAMLSIDPYSRPNEAHAQCAREQ